MGWTQTVGYAGTTNSLPPDVDFDGERTAFAKSDLEASEGTNTEGADCIGLRPDFQERLQHVPGKQGPLRLRQVLKAD
jgi:hypothetical protein